LRATNLVCRGGYKRCHPIVKLNIGGLKALETQMMDSTLNPQFYDRLEFQNVYMPGIFT